MPAVMQAASDPARIMFAAHNVGCQGFLHGTLGTKPDSKIISCDGSMTIFTPVGALIAEHGLAVDPADQPPADEDRHLHDSHHTPCLLSHASALVTSSCLLSVGHAGTQLR